MFEANLRSMGRGREGKREGETLSLLLLEIPDSPHLQTEERFLGFRVCPS